MSISSYELSLSVLVFSFFAMGVAIASRGGVHGRSRFRLRLWGLAGFALLQAGYESLNLLGETTDLQVAPAFKYSLSVVSYLPLLGFAFARRSFNKKFAAGLTIGLAVLGLTIVNYLSAPADMELATRYLVALPAMLVAAWAFSRGRHLRERIPRRAVFAGGLCLLFGLTQLVSAQSSWGALPLMTTGRFEDLLGIPVHAVRALIVLALAPTVTSMLTTFDHIAEQRLLDRSTTAEAMSRESEDRFRAVFDSEPSCIKILDRQGYIRAMNPAGLAMLGVASIDEIRGKSVAAWIVPQDRPRFLATVEAAFRGEASQIRFRLLAEDQNLRWTEQQAVPLFDRDNPENVTGMLAVARDVTEEVESKKRLEEAQRLAKVGSWELDLRRNRLHWSDEIYRIFEIDPKAFGATYEAFLETIHPNDREAVNAAYTNSLEVREPYRIAHRLLMKDGRVKWVDERCETEFDQNGKPLLSRGTVQDITEIKKTADALHQSEAIMLAFLHASPEAIIITDQEARITVFSVGAEAIFGYAAAEIIGESVNTLIPDDARQVHAGHILNFAHMPEQSWFMNNRNEIKGLRKNGEIFPAQASLSKLSSPNGMFFAVVLRDITREKEAQKQLIEAKVAAELANEAKTRFVANMSHELRTPLNAIIGFSDMLTDPTYYRLSDEKRCEYAADISRSGQHLLSIINDILEISRFDLGSARMAEEDVPLVSVVNSCFRMVRIRAQDAGVLLEIDQFPREIVLHADPRLMVQALLNLVNNAIKFTEKGGQITVGTHILDDGGIGVFVRDTGIGMRPEDIARIGEPFMQADSSLNRKFEGSGLGLAIVQRIMHLHGGKLVVDSVPGQGTTAELRLPSVQIRGLQRRGGEPIRSKTVEKPLEKNGGRGPRAERADQ